MCPFPYFPPNIIRYSQSYDKTDNAIMQNMSYARVGCTKAIPGESLVSVCRQATRLALGPTFSLALINSKYSKSRKCSPHRCHVVLHCCYGRWNYSSKRAWIVILFMRASICYALSHWLLRNMTSK